MNNSKLDDLMDQAKLDLIVLISAENIFYLTHSPTILRLKDFQQTRPNSSRLIFAIKEKNKTKPILIVPEFDYKINKKYSNNTKTLCYKQYFTNPIVFLSKILKSKILEKKESG